MFKKILFTALFSGFLVQTFAKPYAEFTGAEIDISKEKKGNKYIYEIKPKIEEKEGVFSFIKSALTFTKKYGTYRKGAATRNIQNLSDISDYNPSVSLASKNEVIFIRVPKDKVFDEPVLLEIYEFKSQKEMPNEKQKIREIRLNLDRNGEFYTAKFKLADENLEPHKAYFWILKDSKFEIEKGMIFVSDTERRIENLVNQAYKKLKLNTNDDLKKALLLARLGYLWKAKNILLKYNFTELDENYKKELIKAISPKE